MSAGNMDILFVDPYYRTSYPPMGLLKIARFHREMGDRTVFVKGLSRNHVSRKWDRIYVSSLFTFNWRTVVRTLRFYGSSVEDARRDLYAGGPLATLLGKDLAREVPCRPISGVIDTAAKIGMEGGDIDALLPDYSILPENAAYPLLRKAWIASATRGCSAKCAFCSVKEVDPRCVEYLPLGKQIENSRKTLGERDVLVLMDNNAAASPFLDSIVDDIRSAGFSGDGSSKKTVDFSQGFEPYLFTGPEGETRADLLAGLPIETVRIAWDLRNEEHAYRNAVSVFSEREIGRFSTYLLYGFADTPEDMHYRLLRITEMEKELGISVNAVPMGYIAPHRKRRYSSRERGRLWGRAEEEARGFEVLMREVGSRVPGDMEYFCSSFGRNGDEFLKKIRRLGGKPAAENDQPPR